MNKDYELTLLTDGQLFGFGGNGPTEEQLDVLKKYGTETTFTDLVALTGGYVDGWKSKFMGEVPCSDSGLFFKALQGKTCTTWTQSLLTFKNDIIRCVEKDGNVTSRSCSFRGCGVRPVLLLSPSLFNEVSKDKVRLLGFPEVFEVEFGEYPQNVVDSEMQDKLERAYDRGAVHNTGNDYTFDTKRDFYVDEDNSLCPVIYLELEYQGKKYIRVKADIDTYKGKFELSNNVVYNDGDRVWVEVKPVKWLIDESTGVLVSKESLVSGILFNYEYDGDFSKTRMKSYLDTHMAKDLFRNTIITKSSDVISKEKAELEALKEAIVKQSSKSGLTMSSDIGNVDSESKGRRR